MSGGTNLFAKESGIEKINRMVNQDKCNYSRLKSYHQNDQSFIKDYLDKAKQIQDSEFMAIPEDE